MIGSNIYITNRYYFNNYVSTLIKQYQSRVVLDDGTFEAQSCLNATLTGINENILKKATLLLTPNAYKTSKLYSIIPSSGNGDFTFFRAGSATETVSNRPIEDVPYNLFQYSEEFSNTYWGKPNGTLTPNVITAPDGNLTADLFAKTGVINSVSNISRTSSTFYLGIITISVYVKKKVGDIVGLRLASGTQFEYNFTTGNITPQGTLLASGSDDAGDGWRRLYLTANVTSSVNPFLLNMFSAAPGDSVYVWGAQMVKGYNRPYIKTTDRNNIPRLDYTLGSCPAMQIEPSRTNLITYSEDMTQSSVYTLSGPTVLSNQIVAPDGNMTADKVVSYIGTQQRFRIGSYGFGISNNTITISVFAKKGELSYLRMGTNIGATIGALFDLDNGTVSSIGTGIGRITSYPGGWYRCSITGAAGGACDMYLTDSSGNVNYTGNGTDGLFLWGWQFEQWPGAGLTTTNVFNATSYMPTYNTTITRASEGLALSNLVTNNIVSATGGTWFVHIVDNIPITREDTTPADGGIFIADSATGTQNSIAIRRTTSGTLRRAEIAKAIGGVITTDVYTTTANEVKLVVRYNIGVAGSFDVFENGVKVVTANAFTGNVPLTYIGTRTSASVSESPFTNIKSMALFNTQLSDAECLALTTL
jgi:hypothetical protein